MWIVAGKNDLRRTAEELQEHYGKENLKEWVADFTDNKQILKVKDSLTKSWGQLDGIVANIGNGKSVSDPISDPAQWQKVWSVNFESSLFTVRNFLPYLSSSKGSMLSFLTESNLLTLQLIIPWQNPHLFPLPRTSRGKSLPRCVSMS